MLDNIISRKVADTIASKADKTAGDKAGAAVLKTVAMKSIDTSDKAAFSGVSAAADQLSPEQVVAQLKSSMPQWTKDNRDAYKDYVMKCLQGIKNLRDQLVAPKAALDKANADLSAVQAQAVVPVNQAQNALNAVDGQFRPAANAASNRLASARTAMRTTMRSGADNAQNAINSAANEAANARGAVQAIRTADVNVALSGVDGGSQNIIASANRMTANAGAVAGAGNALAGNADQGVAQVGQGVVSAGNGMAQDSGTILQNATNIQYGVQKIRSVHADVANTAAGMDSDLYNAQQRLANAASDLAANPADDTVLAHARQVATAADTNGYVAGRDALVADYAGANPGDVMNALNDAETVSQRVQAGAGAIAPDAQLANDLATMDQTAGVIGATGSKIQQGNDFVRQSLGGIQTQDPDLVNAISAVSAPNEALATDAGNVVNTVPMLGSGPVQALDAQIRQATDATATGAANMETYITSARQALGGTPTDASIKGSATELVSSYDANTQAWSALNNALVAPQKTLADAQAKYAADIAPTQQVVAGAQSAFDAVNRPLASLVDHTRGLPDSVPMLTKGWWNNPAAFWDHDKVDVNKVLEQDAQQVLGGNL